MHHYVGDAGGVAGAGQEDAGVGIHGRLVGGHGPVQFPHYDAFRVVEEVVADAGDGGDEGDGEGTQLGGGADAGVQEEAGGVDCAGAEDGFFKGCEGEGGAGLEGDIYACYGGVGNVDAADPGGG